METLQAALEEVTEISRVKREQASSREFELLDNVLLQQQQVGLAGAARKGEESVKDDLMSQIEIYEDKLKEKDLVIHKLGQASHLNQQLVQQIQEMNNMVHSVAEDDIIETVEDTDGRRVRHESFDVPNSYEPETLPEYVQMEEVQKLKDHIGSLVSAKSSSSRVRHNSSDLPPNVQKILEDKNDTILKMKQEIQAMKATTDDMLDDQGGRRSASGKRSSLEVQEERTQRAFLENERAERETERKLQKSWSSDEVRWQE